MQVDQRHRVAHKLAAAPHVGVYSLGEMYSISCMAVVVWPLTLAPLQSRDGACRVFTDQANIACTKREAP